MTRVCPWTYSIPLAETLAQEKEGDWSQSVQAMETHFLDCCWNLWVIGNFFQIRAAKQGRYKLSLRRWQLGENLLKYYPTVRRAELRGVERLISYNIWAPAGSRTWGFTPWTSQIHGQCTSSLFKLDEVGFLPFVSKHILTNPPIHWSRGKTTSATLFPNRAVDDNSMHDEMMACLELEFAVPLAVATGGLEDLVSESCRKEHKGAL